MSNVHTTHFNINTIFRKGHTVTLSEDKVDSTSPRLSPPPCAPVVEPRRPSLSILHFSLFSTFAPESITYKVAVIKYVVFITLL